MPATPSPAGPPAPALLTSGELALISRLALGKRRPAGGPYPGLRRSPRTARSPELADFRPYAPGDDIRQIDWRAYARMEKLMLRLYVAEEESALNVVVDTSESMALGRPAKWPAARGLAAAVALVGLAGSDRVAVGVLDPAGPFTAHVRGAAGSSRLAAFVDRLAPSGPGGPHQLAQLSWLKPGLTVVVSDFLGQGDWASALAGLGRGAQEPLAWQVLAPEEEEPALAGELTLVEAETGRTRQMTVNPRVVAAYRRALAQLRDGLRRQAAAAGGWFVHSRSDDDLAATLAAAVAVGAMRRA
ncbi:MAG: DUF58 domain-containing protein [Acidimicrobiales bacterium]